mmetsp:Transcript_22002/g.47831  ORF Transcript_22002/g.47831 Transcript_22002/m.47831 type:complete len:606 (+) Transcript_22002:143-1960(+)|eukprot:CAMPEP_0172322252 /NCGR_PEP_ID=MMETSP1058-20130122/45414_1 /TAXON_ID=83371 /ORGANISM="Detonula confervacea, Strain CCMP 353" /LENGTH=605 /DNA_ID=CAMNT_0013037953 /DNA_START=121 /DNA_END=1938 /DNA_ORIENTATION=-
MAPNWPNTIAPRHHRIRKRAEAYASALYYSECSLRGISPNGAAKAEENARSCISRWWLKGNDPNHPSLQGNGSTGSKGAQAAEENPKPNQASASSEINDEDTRTGDENGSYVAGNQEEDNDPLEGDSSNAPILARDDDFGSSFGTLNNFCSDWDAVAQKNQKDLSNNSPLLPSRLTRPHTTHVVSPQPQVSERVEDSSMEMLNSYYSSSPNQLLTQEKEKDLMSKIKSPVAVAQVSSGSEADGSVYSSSLSYDDSTTFYPKPRFQNVESTFKSVTKSRKRGRADVSPLGQSYLDARVESAKTELLSRLENEGISLAFRKELASLEKYAKLKASTSKNRKTSSPVHSLDSTDVDGTWLMISPPEYPSCLGKNADGDSLFTLGRMTFDMFQPSNLVCSIQKQYNTIKSVELKDFLSCVPKSLRKEVDNERNGRCSGRLKTYNIIASFTIEQPDGSPSNEDAPPDKSKKLRGILTSYGYALPDPTNPDRKSIWFTGGTIEPAENDSLEEWKKIFGTTSVTSFPSEAPPVGDTTKKQSLIEAEKARTLASKILLGAVHAPMDNQGIVGFHLKKPIGGHGSAYCDIVYNMDDTLRVMRGHSGSIYVFKRV